MRQYVSLLEPELISRIRTAVWEGIARCKRTWPPPKSEVDILTELLTDKSAEVRGGAADGLGTLLSVPTTNGGKVDPRVMIPALRDSNKQVRRAAILGLARSGRDAVPVMI